MRSSISVALLIISIIIAIVSTFGASFASAHGAGLGVVQAAGGTGLLMALIVGLMGLAVKPSPMQRSNVVSVVAPTATLWPVYQHEADFFEGFIPGEEGFDAREVQTWEDTLPVSTVRDMAEPEDMPFVAQSFLRRGGQCTSTVYLRKG